MEKTNCITTGASALAELATFKAEVDADYALCAAAIAKLGDVNSVHARLTGRLTFAFGFLSKGLFNTAKYLAAHPDLQDDRVLVALLDAETQKVRQASIDNFNLPK